MKLTPETRATANVVLGYAGGEVRLATRVLRASAIVTAEHVLDWPARSVAALVPDSFAPVLALEPEVVLLGTSPRQEFPDAAIYAHVCGRGVGFEAMELGAACRTYNVLLGEDRRVALAVLIDG